MAIVDVKVPQLSESVAEATLLQWKKKAGEAVAQDEILIEIETDKVVLEVPAPAAGVLSDIAAKDGETVAVGTLLGQIKEGAGTPAKFAAAPTGQPDQKTATTKPIGAGPEEPKPRPEPRTEPRP